MGSHESSSGLYPFHLIWYSVIPFLFLWSRISSTSNSSSSASISSFDSLGVVLVRNYRNSAFLLIRNGDLASSMFLPFWYRIFRWPNWMYSFFVGTLFPPLSRKALPRVFCHSIFVVVPCFEFDISMIWWYIFILSASVFSSLRFPHHIARIAWLVTVRSNYFCHSPSNSVNTSCISDCPSVCWWLAVLRIYNPDSF